MKSEKKNEEKRKEKWKKKNKNEEKREEKKWKRQDWEKYGLIGVSFFFFNTQVCKRARDGAF